MERVEPEVFRRHPAGHFVAGATWLHFCPEPGLFGVVLFGRPDREQGERLVRSLRVELEPHVPRHRSIVDTSRIEAADAGAFEAIAAYVREERAALGEKVERLVLVRPSGLEGAVVAGFFGVLEAPYPVTVVSDARAGLAALGAPDGLAAVLDAGVATVRGVDPIVGRLRDHLAARLAEATMAGACSALGLSERTLQRRLTEAGTSFRAELTSARLKAAARRLTDTQDPITAIALDAGFSSLQHFSTKFSEVFGASPTLWRERARGAAAPGEGGARGGGRT
ncbi:MAG: helix-turn-helix transcriptional regulator [Polyangiaceae bacterium]|nr:helix-turn-helix transcriptional regulator [Polyangiaceae bacterium]